VPLALSVTASDPDSQAITELKAIDLPSGASFTPNGDNTSGTLHWTPDIGNSGSYTVTFVAINALSDTSSTQITVTAPSTGVAPPDVALSRPVLVPSPLRSRSTLSFSLSEPGPLEVDLMDLSGRRVRSLMSSSAAAPGTYHVPIDGYSDRGVRLASGIYLYRIQAARRRWTGRLVVTR